MVEETKQAEIPVVEVQTNCLGCNKPLRKIRRYYRDGKFYCIKRCWRAYLDKSKAGAGEQK